MAITFACGFHCGVSGTAGMHLHNGGSGTRSFVTTQIPGLAARRYNPTTSKAYDNIEGNFVTTTQRLVVSFDLYIATRPSNDCTLFAVERAIGNCEGLAYQNSSQSLRAFTNTAGGAMTLGANGFTVNNGDFVHVEMHINDSVNPRTIDLTINGTSLTQLTKAATAQNLDFISMGCSTNGSPNNVSGDIYYFNLIGAQTVNDFPLGKCRILQFVPDRDGTHNTANTANTFERGNSGTDIIDSTTTAYQLIDDTVLPSGAVDAADNIQITNNTPTNTWYTEHRFPGCPRFLVPISVEAIVVNHEASTSNCGRVIRLRDNNGATSDDIYSSVGAGATAYRYTRKNYPNIFGTANPWTRVAFDNMAIRWGFSADGNPDVNLDAVMLEVVFPEEFFYGRPYGPLGYNQMHQILVR